MTMKYQTSEDVLSREVGGELVLMQLANGYYFGLNAVGGLVWRMLEDSGATTSDLAAALTNQFDITVDQATSDVNELLEQLIDSELVRPANGVE